MQDFLMNNLNYFLVGSFLTFLFSNITANFIQQRWLSVVASIGLYINLALLIWNVKLQDQATLYLLNNDNMLHQMIMQFAQRGTGT
jgi:hypothetical protein